MDLTDRFVGEMNSKLEGESAEIDARELVMRLLLTDTVVLKTHRLLEVPDLIRIFGVEGLLHLLDSGKLQLACESFAIGFKLPQNGPDDRYFEFVCVWEADREDYLGRAFNKLRNLRDGSRRFRAEDLKPHLVLPPTDATATAILSQLRKHLVVDNGLIKAGIALRCAADLRTQFAPEDVELDVKQVAPSTYVVRSNLESLCSRSRPECRDVLGRGILGVAELYKRFEEMKRHTALTGARDTDLPMFDRYLSFIGKALDPSPSLQQFGRVVQLTGAPDISRATRLDAKKLVTVAGSAECLEFRKWLRSAEGEADAEVLRRFGSLGASLGVGLTSGAGRGLRWLASTLTALLPDGGAISGPIAGAIDGFVVDRVIKAGGPTVFLNRLYPSIFLDS